MRIRSDWTSKSWARKVADILAFSACRATIIAFRAAGSSGRTVGASDMHMDNTGIMEMP